MTDHPTEEEIRNHEIVSKLRDEFRPAGERLTPEVEPATVFVLRAPEAE
ncbi:MAG TPA: hypothetical protein VGL97_12350 [Bryobacteraceae bacterium]|jgi:hypothetical protein